MPRRLSFHIKLILAAALVALADLLFLDRGKSLGGAVGAFALAWLAAALVAHPALRRDARARTAAAVAAAFGLLLIETFTLLGWLLYCTALGVAVLSPRAGRLDDAWRWFQRLAFQGLAGLVGPAADWLALRKVRRRSPPRRLTAGLGLVAMPILGGLVFFGLFAFANPVISQALARLSIPPPNFGRGVFWLFVAVPVWGALRPRFLRRPLALPRLGTTEAPGLSAASTILSLAVFNLLFAGQNALDLAFLWSGAPLPEGVTLAEYAHRGAYPLIVTALLAGLFVLVALRPGSRTAERPLVRWLVIAWIAQNLFLVASTMLRTLDYVEAYSLTRLRIAALAWMVLVAVGLVLICWRMLKNRGAAWLINANVLCAGLVLTLASIVDEGALAAAWNVRHAREVGGRGAELDLCYLRGLQGASLIPLTELAQAKALPPAFRDRVAFVRGELAGELDDRQSQWRSWTWRGQRRLDRAERLLAARPIPPALPGARDDCGVLQPPPKPVQTGATPLTAPPAD
ncbi:DUF4173 domain-containing protein [Phenylobacterium sp. LH3H17]|uniref:DUF4153 domain-containing protein n=1 Tax=Phenylobacterium sp. LH3H17 TaxID=2903901 RepID=UPI0020C9A527|nr:DUF4173 domain-containing protein [Phenylobacterium sp. LH3H17]UTP40885.1 DUF4173 domain-containing protein [Phenylobacterium sp. LH3H17]